MQLSLPGCGATLTHYPHLSAVQHLLGHLCQGPACAVAAVGTGAGRRRLLWPRDRGVWRAHQRAAVAPGALGLRSASSGPAAPCLACMAALPATDKAARSAPIAGAPAAACGRRRSREGRGGGAGRACDHRHPPGQRAAHVGTACGEPVCRAALGQQQAATQRQGRHQWRLAGADCRQHGVACRRAAAAGRRSGAAAA